MTDRVRTFPSGATRDQNDDKINYEGFLSPLVLRRYGEYMHAHRIEANGRRRAADNWMLGIPLNAYMESAWRHLIAWWSHHRGVSADEGLEDALCAVIFNASGYLHEILKDKRTPPEP